MYNPNKKTSSYAAPRKPRGIHNTFNQNAQLENQSLKTCTENPLLLHFFVTAPRALEKVLEEEVKRIAENIGEPIEAATLTEGGLSFTGSLKLAWAINLYSRVANRVLWKLAEGFYRDDRDIYTLARQINWSRFFKESCTLRVDTVAIFSPLKSITIATLRAKDGLCDHFRDIYGIRPSVDKSSPDVRVRLFIEKRSIYFYLDLSGEALFKRGYRQPSQQADSSPIRENLAAGLLMWLGWQPDQPLYDPFCGSGTFLIEAARMALNIPSGAQRSFAFQKLLSYDEPIWNNLLEKAHKETLTPEQLLKDNALPTLIGADIDPHVLVETREHLSSLNWDDWITLSLGDFASTHTPEVPSNTAPLLIANPPYGARMSETEYLHTQYPLWGRQLKHAYTGWKSAWISADPQLASGLGLRPKKKISLYNGDLPVQFLLIPLFAGKRNDHLNHLQNS